MDGIDLMRVLVCGGRTFTDYKLLAAYLDWRLNPEGKPLAYENGIEVIHGMANGADMLADKWANNNHCTVHGFAAEWATYGKRAGYLRNLRMLMQGKPDLVIAFPGGTGTAMMVKLAEEANVPVEMVQLDWSKPKMEIGE